MLGEVAGEMIRVDVDAADDPGQPEAQRSSVLNRLGDDMFFSLKTTATLLLLAITATAHAQVQREVIWVV